VIDCLILGDSIAVGVGQALPLCEVSATVGITSGRFIQTEIGSHAARHVVISLGVNDRDGVATLDNLRKLRASVSAEVVYWLLSGFNPRAREAGLSVASQYGDRVIEMAPFVGADGLHPDRNGYAALGHVVQSGWMQPAPAAGAYRDFAPPPVVPGINIWSGPDNLNGHVVPARPARGG
jgi:hypothetical protein